jgi:hypothetical protein
MKTDATTKEATARARADFNAALINTFRSPDGKRILEWLHTTAATRKPAFTPGRAGAGIDPLAAAIRDGRKSIVWEIEANLEAAESAGATNDAPPVSRARARV